MIGLAVNILLGIRYFFWKTIVQTRGGWIKKGVKIYERVKIYSTAKSPVFVGEDCVLQTGAILASADNGRIKLGKNVYLGEYSILSSKGEIDVGENSIIASLCFVCDFNHRFDDPEVLFYDSGCDYGRIDIGKNVWIGAGCKILKDVAIGDGCVIGAGSVVTRSIPAYSIAVGVPARVIKKRKDT